MNNDLIPLNILNSIKKSSRLHNILHTSNSTLNMVNNLIPIYSNIKPVINNVKTIHKAFKSVKTNNNKEEKIIKKDIGSTDNSISFFQ